MFTSRDSDDHWERFGKTDPYFGVLSEEQYKYDTLDNESRLRFFASGKEHIDTTLQNVRAHFLPEFHPDRALDFGCGVGRLVIPLSFIAKEVVGIDVSHSMIEEAKRNCAEQEISNVRFVADIAELASEPKFDFIHSILVFQHIPVARGLAIVEAMIERLKPGGVATLQFTYHAPVYARLVHWTLRNIPFACNLYNLIMRRKLTYPVMQANFYCLNRLFRILQNLRCNKVFSEFTDSGRNSGIMIYFQKDI